MQTKFLTPGIPTGAGLLALCASFGCVYEAPHSQAYAQPQPLYTETRVEIQDDYVYYPAYEVYYSRNRRMYTYRDGGSWVSRSTPPHVSAQVLFTAPSVTLDFHDSPSAHHAVVVQQYPRHWAPPGQNQGNQEQPYASAAVTVSTPGIGIAIHTESDFYEPLAPNGEWVTVGSYGRCWRPAHVEVGWRPYCHGNWVLTDNGWYWMSDEPWAWATYHYGRWDFTDQYGWYWVPQTHWAPAWVSWHEGGGYVGWAPLQPSVSISVNGYVGFNQSRIPPRAFVFVEQRHFMEPVRPTTVVINNTTIINKTTVNLSNTRMVNNTVINRGPSTTVIEKASGRKVQAVAVRELRQKDEAVVVTRQRSAQSSPAKRSQPPLASEVKATQTRSVVAHQPAAVERPVVSPTGQTQQREQLKVAPLTEAAHPVPVRESLPQHIQQAQIEKHTPGSAETAREHVLKPQPNVENDHHGVNKLPTEPKGEKPGHQNPHNESPATIEKHESPPQEQHEEKRTKD